ncbi:RasGEF domain containing protein [Histomonas meleagridis]|uniref:RasGEF domain containing protein n=1 Tax=Histomonas meleagridis TaxID=135588 RepID=UPI003559F821|nr:RasGEF domain containing protein [Histomonas meleagridis]KAH0806079.1 RasGEF domain containing protein [Histomonas meleagridis]
MEPNSEAAKSAQKKRPPVPGSHQAQNLPKTQFSGTAGIPQLNFPQNAPPLGGAPPLAGALPKTQFSGQLGIPTSLQIPASNPLLSKPLPPRPKNQAAPLSLPKQNDSQGSFFTLMSLPQTSVMSLNPFTSSHDKGHAHRKKHRKVRKVDAKTTDFSKMQCPHSSSMPHSSLIQSLNPFSGEQSDDDNSMNDLGISIINPNVNPVVLFYNILDIHGETQDELERLNTAVFMEKSEYIGDSTQPQAASFNQLILFLTSPDSPNIEFQKMFLMTFSSFSTPPKLLAALLTRYYCDITVPESNIKSEEELKQVRVRVVRILSSWSKMSPSQFTDDMIHALHEFLKVIENDPNCKMQVNVLSSSLDGLRGKEIKTVRKTSVAAPQPIIGDELPKTILDVDPVELARQASILHNAIFCRIGSLELLTMIWGTKKGGSQNVDELTEHFDMFSRYVQLTVIQGEDVKERAKVFKHWVETAIAFREMNNFHGVFTVVCALTHRSVLRMKETVKASLKLLARPMKKQYEQLVELCMFQNDFHNYREVLEHVHSNEPCVPFIGSLQRDLIYVQNSYPNKIEGLTNVQKCQACVSLLKLVERFQNLRYQFQEVKEIQELITTFPELPDTTEMMKLSMEKEPKKK